MNSASCLALAALLTAASLSSARGADLSGEAIDGATLADWESRRPPVEPGSATGDTTDAGEPAGDSAASETAGTSGAETSEPEKPVVADPFLIRLQVLLDRAHSSPGVIDGFFGENTVKAIRAYEQMHDLAPDGQPDAEFWAVLAADGAPAMKSYEITGKDVDETYVKKIPDDYAELAKMKRLGFRGPAEMLAERFHLDEDLLNQLNPKADFDKAGTTLLVPDTGSEPETKVTRIVVDKAKGELLAYGEDGKLVLVDPASIGSEDTPSPTGEVTVEAIAPRPSYTYDPSKNFKQGKNAEVLTIPPGPNGPVGSVWIDLSKPTYGIHGTPEPSHIDKSGSHGCVRLTNWDAEALAKLVEPKVTTVTFQE